MAWDSDENCIKVKFPDQVHTARSLQFDQDNDEGTKSSIFENTLSFAMTKFINLKSGNFKQIPNSPQYFMTMHMFEQARNFIFNGGLINLNPCLPGRGGQFC